VGAGAIGNVSQDLGPVLELNPVHAVGKRLKHDPLHKWGALGHERRLYQMFVPTRRYAPTSPRGGEVTWPLGEGWAVRIRGPASVIATVCSK
jgi:hypothetical protein